MKYNLTIIGVKDTTEEIIKFVHNNICKVDLILTIDDSVLNSANISGYKSLEKLHKDLEIPIYKVFDYSLKDSDTQKFFDNNEFDIAICLGWQRLIPNNILCKFKFGVFGFHGSCGYLPFGRGRSPLNWSLINDDKRYILNLFKYDDRADSPNVFSKKVFEISEYDNIRTLQYKTLICSKSQICELIAAYKKNNICISTKSKDFDSWYKKRSAKDGELDFSWRTKKLYNIIRAVTHPFPGAFSYINSEKVIIWSAIPFDYIIDFSKYEPGEIIEIYDNKLIVRTIDGSLLIKSYDSNIELKVGLKFKKFLPVKAE